MTFTDCKVKIGDSKTQTDLVIRSEADYAEIVVRDEYNKVEPTFGYLPGPNTLVTFTFTVNGLSK